MIVCLLVQSVINPIQVNILLPADPNSFAAELWLEGESRDIPTVQFRRDQRAIVDLHHKNGAYYLWCGPLLIPTRQYSCPVQVVIIPPQKVLCTVVSTHNLIVVLKF
jgi:hypothetical protein